MTEVAGKRRDAAVRKRAGGLAKSFRCEAEGAVFGSAAAAGLRKGNRLEPGPELTDVGKFEYLPVDESGDADVISESIAL